MPASSGPSAHGLSLLDRVKGAIINRWLPCINLTSYNNLKRATAASNLLCRTHQQLGQVISERERSIAILEQAVAERDRTIEVLTRIATTSDRLSSDAVPTPPPEFHESSIQVNPDVETFLQSAGEHERAADALLDAGIEFAFRGPEPLIKERQAAYLPSLIIPERNRHLPVLDIGCGRGEFLTLLKERGIPCIGVDVSAWSTGRLAEKGLEAYQMEAMEYLVSRPDASLSAITAFQVVEHLDHQDLRKLLELSYDKLAPKGIILLETVNPFCLEVFRSYYLDPTHRHPVPKDLLLLMLRVYGFQNFRLFYQGCIPTTERTILSDWSCQYENYALMATRP